jgi:Associated with HOX
MDDQSMNNLSYTFPTWNERNHTETTQITSLTLSPQFESVNHGNSLSLSLASHIHPDHTKSIYFNPSSYVIQNSPYLKPAQELLDEVVCISSAAQISATDGRTLNGRFLQLGERINSCYSKEKGSVQTKLISLLNEVYI